MLDLNKCSGDCISCIKAYKKKHQLIAGEKFKIPCNGILKDEVLEQLLCNLPEEEAHSARAIIDPITWAAENLDWHCLDPDGEIWRRKNPQEYYKWIAEHPGEDIYGHSRYHRPYQALMLLCSSKYKVFRVGRQAGKTESLVISILYHIFTAPNTATDEGFKVVVITPYLEQIELIFTKLSQLIKSSPILRNSVARYVKAPNYTIQLNNGSRVKGFTAGTKSGSNAGSVRGQAAHFLVFDEADMLSEEDIDASLAIITNYPEAKVWMSSTPTGRRAKFYNTCHSPSWKEFFFPSSVNPLWDEEKEAMFREQHTTLGYIHEIEAEFGEQEQGVFQNVFIQAAKQRYRYGDFAYNKNWTYTIGVDWNDEVNGTQIVVLGFNPSHGKFYIVDRANVSRAGWTQLDACQKIIDYNKLWHPISIYIDKGFGGNQWEVLRKYSYDAGVDPSRGPSHPDAKIKHILRAYDFSTKIEVRDLWTHEPIKKDAKPFLIENLVRRFERQEICFSSQDKALEDQLLAYVIDHITVTGRPVYKAGEKEGDHIIDALALAMIAVTLEKSPFGKPVIAPHIAFSGQFGEKVTPDAREGDILIVNEYRKRQEQSREYHKPTTDRWDVGNEVFAKQDLPAAHVSAGKVGLWSWPGFLADEPKPTQRKATLGNSPRSARMKKPRRKLI